MPPEASSTTYAAGSDEPGCCPSLAVVGATGAVGREFLALAHARGFTPHRVCALASARSAGACVPFGDSELEVRAVGTGAFKRCDIVVFAADAETSRAFAPAAVGAGATVIDNSCAFRMDADVPLIVPEVNGHLLDAFPRIVSNPNCTTIILVAALDPLRRAFGVEAIDVATYQAVSGAGAAAVDELLEQTKAFGCARGGYPHEKHPIDPAPSKPRVFAEPCAFNVFSHDSAVDPESGVNGEEQKMIAESRKIWEDRELRVTPTCVRVPVLRAHTEAITVTLREAATEADVRRALEHASGVRLIDDRAGNVFPTPRGATGLDEVLVGRVRPDPGEAPDPARPGRRRRWCLLACADQLRRGAALNAMQIAERLWSTRGERGMAPGLPRAG